MKKLIGLMLLLAFASQPAFVSASDETVRYDQCTADSDCIYVEGVCPGDWDAINKRYKKEHEEKVATMAAFVECGPPTKQGTPTTQPYCEKNMCY